MLFANTYIICKLKNITLNLTPQMSNYISITKKTIVILCLVIFLNSFTIPMEQFDSEISLNNIKYIYTYIYIYNMYLYYLLYIYLHLFYIYFIYIYVISL